METRLPTSRHRCVWPALRLFMLLVMAGLAGHAPAQERVPLWKLADRHNFIAHVTHGKQITLRTRFSTFRFEGDSRKLFYNDVLIWLNAPIARSWGTWNIHSADVEHTVLPLLNPPRALRREKYRIVALDPGHGGADSGALNTRLGLYEKTIVLDLAQRVRSILLKYNVDARLTRTGDQAVELDNRCFMANRWGADLFVSIHLNAAANKSSAGVETHILPPAGSPITASASAGSRDRMSFPGNNHDGANLLLGYALQKSVLKYTGAEDRGVRRSRFYVIRNVSCPSALLECGFISNNSEASRMASPAYRDKLVKGIAEGIMDYLNSGRRALAQGP